VCVCGCVGGGGGEQTACIDEHLFMRI